MLKFYLLIAIWNQIPVHNLILRIDIFIKLLKWPGRNLKQPKRNCPKLSTTNSDRAYIDSWNIEFDLLNVYREAHWNIETKHKVGSRLITHSFITEQYQAHL